MSPFAIVKSSAKAAVASQPGQFRLAIGQSKGLCIRKGMVFGSCEPSEWDLLVSGSNGADLNERRGSSRCSTPSNPGKGSSSKRMVKKEKKGKEKKGKEKDVKKKDAKKKGTSKAKGREKAKSGNKDTAEVQKVKDTKKSKSVDSTKSAAPQQSLTAARTPEPESEQKRRSTIAEEEARASVGLEAVVESNGGGRSRSRSGGSSVLASFGKSRRKKARAQEADTGLPSAEPPGEPEASPARHRVGKGVEEVGGGSTDSAGEAEDSAVAVKSKAATEGRKGEKGVRGSGSKRSKGGKGGKKSSKSCSRKASRSGSRSRSSHSRKGSSSRRRTHKEDCTESAPIDFCGGFSVPLEQAKSDFVCLSEDDIVAEQSVQIANITEVLSVSTSTSVALLKHFKWNKDRLMTAYFTDPAQALRDAGAAVDDTGSRSAPVEGPADECTICGEELSGSNSYSLQECRHAFCTDCWEQYLTIKINEGQTTQLACPHQLCGALLPEDAIRSLVPEEVYQKFCQFFMQSFVNDSEHVKWCPAPNCGRAVTAAMVQRQTVLCSCGHRFCFKCSEEAHLPATCGEVKEWKKKCQDESETRHWIMANTRDCPKCQLPTEKNGGCNHMTCQQCKHDYCWICMKDWKGHNDYYTCNRFPKAKEEKSKVGKKAGKRERERQREEVRRALEREFDLLQEVALGKMQELQETEATVAELLYIEQAACQLRECRELLKYSYVHRFYMQDGVPEEELFTFLQESLEITVEKLAAALQRPKNRRVEIMNLTSLAQRQLFNMLDAVEV